MLGDDEADEYLFLPELKRAGYAANEADLTRAIKENKSKMLVYYAAVAMKKYGTQKSIPLLKSLLDYPKVDVKIVSLIAIANIAGNKEKDLYVQLLSGRNTDMRLYSMAIIWQLDIKEALPQVVRLAEDILRDRIKHLEWRFEPLYTIEYLQRHPQEGADVLARLQKRYHKENWNLKDAILRLIGR